MNFTSLGFRCQYNFVPSIFLKGKPTIKNIHESKEIQKLFQDLYKVTQQTINIWIALVQSVEVSFFSSIALLYLHVND